MEIDNRIGPLYIESLQWNIVYQHNILLTWSFEMNYFVVHLKMMDHLLYHYNKILNRLWSHYMMDMYCIHK